jgi:hypothetical protein
VTHVRLDFRLLDASGWVDVELEPNTNPEALACPPFAKGFPVCTAIVTYAGEGYKAALGWVQLVRSTDGAGKEFELDPFEPLGRSPHPFCFYGFAPTLFDAPARRSREDMDWGAETFLCFVPMAARRQEVRAILGFSWGFSIQKKAISLTPLALLAPMEWNKHRALLGREHPAWSFAADYRSQ